MMEFYIEKLLNIITYKDGFYIECGSNDGVTQSYTYELERTRNWKGILIEPSIQSFNNCKLNRSDRNIFINCALVGDENIKEIRGDFDGNLMSSVNGIRMNRLGELIKISSRTINSILDEYYYINKIDLFSLDVEGYELEILKGIDFKKHPISYILIEIYKNDYNKIIELLKNNDYELMDCLTGYNKIDNPGWDGTHNDYLFKKHTELYIYHYLGMGDHIICNAIVRHYAKLYDKIYLFVKNHNYISVKFMYQDLDNIVFIVGQVYSDGIDTFVLPYIEKYQDKILRIGYKDIGLSFDEYFYYSNGISFEKRWSDFYVDRNPYSEMEIFNKFNVHEDYIFLHEDVNRNYIIDRNYIINKDLRIISPIEGLTDNIFDYCYLLEKAKEVHCIDSSFRLLADSINLKTLDLFYHINRNQDDKLYSSSLKNWKKILY